MGDTTVIGTLRVPEAFDHRIGYEVARWHKTIRVEPGDYPVTGRVGPNGKVIDTSIAIRFEGEVIASDFTSLFGGVAIAGAPNKVNSHVGERATDIASPYAHAIARQLLGIGRDDARGTIELSSGFEARWQTSMIDYGRWVTTAGIFDASKVERWDTLYPGDTIVHGEHGQVCRVEHVGDYPGRSTRTYRNAAGEESPSMLSVMIVWPDGNEQILERAIDYPVCVAHRVSDERVRLTESGARRTLDGKVGDVCEVIQHVGVNNRGRLVRDPHGREQRWALAEGDFEDVTDREGFYADVADGKVENTSTGFKGSSQ